jgi:serine/threonine protein kinase
VGNKFVETEEEDSQKECSLVGTEAYIAPEAIQKLDVTILTDLWSLGVIIY